MSKYYRVWNSKTKNSWFINPDEVSNLKGRSEHYVSTYYYNQKHKEQFDQTKSVKGITDVKTDQLWFDFDSHTDLNLPKNDAITLIDNLKKKGFTDNNIEVYYSSNKGYHVIVKLSTELNRKQVEGAVERLGKGLETLDMSLYDWNQLLRAPSTKNDKTGLYKTQITIDQLKNLTNDQIRQLSAIVNDVNYASPVDLPSELLTPPEQEKKVEVLPVLTNDPLRIREIDFTNKPHGWKDYKWAIAQGRFEKGKRNHSMMVIASTCRALKYGRDHTAAICEAADKLHCQITNDLAISESALTYEVLDVVFGSSWNGGQYSVENDLELRKYCEVNGFKVEKDELETPIIGLHDVSKSFKEFIKNIDKNTIKTGITELDTALPITVGMNLGILGAPSSGKTALALEILKHTSMSGVVSVIASLDMHRNRLYEKVMYKVSHDVYKRTLSREELYNKVKSDTDDKLSDEVKKQFGNVYFYDRSSPSVEDLRQFVLQVEAQTGQKVKLLMIDYFERIGSEITDATASSLKIMNQIQDLLNDLNLAVITLVQPNKFSLTGGPDSPILNYSAIKGSSFLSQSFRSIISIWRPFFTPKTKHLDKFLEMAILKNDLGELDHFKFNWDGKTGSITTPSEEAEVMYEDYLREKKQILSPNPDDDGGGRFRRD